MDRPHTKVYINHEVRFIFEHDTNTMIVEDLAVPVRNWWAELLALWRHAKSKSYEVRITQTNGDTHHGRPQASDRGRRSGRQ
jgi:hypothetical protein